MPDKSVLSHLSDAEKGQLLAAYWSSEHPRGSRQHPRSRTSSFDIAAMIVRRGTDSSTWNQAAGAWNKSREHWISLLHALKMEEVTEKFLPGKVMRLMAADVAYWHQAVGGDIHPDTKVWAELPKPWEVLSGTAVCNKAMVEAACLKHGVKPENWFGPKLDREPVAFKPTRELVHGVAVASPSLALALRKAGVFSGQGLSEEVPEVNVARDEHGFAISAS